MEKRADQNDKLSALHELTLKVYATKSASALAAVAIDQVASAVGPDVVFFYLRQGDKLLLIDSWQRSVGKSVISPEVKDMGVCLCGLAASEHRPYYSKEIHRDPLCTLSECKKAGIQSFASLPLSELSKVIGVLSLASFSLRDFQKESMFLEILSSHISAALANALVSEKLSKSELRYKSLFETNPLPMWVYDTQSLVFLTVNHAAVLHYGYSREEFLSMSIKDIRPEVEVPELIETTSRKASGLFRSGLWLHRKKDGAVFHVDITAHDIDFEGRPARLVIANDMTESMKAEEALQNSELRLKKAQHYAHMGSWTWNIKTGELEWSDEMFNLFGIKRDAFTRVLPDVIAQAIHPDDRAKVEQSNLSVIKDKKPMSLEYRVVWPDQSIHTVYAEAGELLLDEMGNPWLLSGIVQDITERKRAEGMIRESENRTRSIIDSLPIGVHMYRLESDGRLVFTGANPAADKILGLDNNIFIGKTIEEAFPRLKATEVPLRYREAAASGKAWLMESIEYQEGAIHGAFEVHAFQTAPDTMAAAFEDITLRKRSELALQQSEEKYRRLYNETPIMLHSIDRNGIVVEVNDYWLKTMGYERNEVIGRKVTDFYMDASRKYAQEVIYPAFFQGGIVKEISYQFVKKNGEIIDVLLSATAERDASGNIVRSQAVIEDITERKQAEEALRKNEDKYRNLFNNSEVGMFRTRFDGSEILDMNKKFLDIFGRTREEMQDVASVIHWADTGERDEMVRRLEADGNVSEFECKLVNKQGSVRNCLASVRLYREQGILEGSIIDITERKQAEEEVRKSRETLEKTFRSLDSALFILDNSNPPVVMECNPAATGIFGYEKREMLGNTTEFLHVNKESLSQFQMNNYAAIKEKGFLTSFEFRMKRKNGELFPTEHSVFPLLDDFGNRTGWISVVKDIIERRRADQQTKDALNFIRTMMESSPIGIVSIKATGAVVAANETVARMMGGTIDQLLKQNVRHVEAWKKYGFLFTMDEALATNSERSIETYYVSTFGKEVWLSARFVPYIFEGESHVLTLLADMSDRKRNEAEKEKLQAQLLQAQKMEAIGTLAGGIAHDFNNVLAAIVGYGSILQMKMRSDDPFLVYTEQILAAADRASGLTQSLLAFSRKQVINPKNIDLNASVQKVDTFLSRIIGEDVFLTMSLCKQPLIIFADAIQIEQALMNLATNARDAMPKGGSLIISTEWVDNENLPEAGNTNSSASYAMLSVTDTGIGMDEQTQTKIFEPFFTTKEVGRGTGLGLAIVYGVVKQNNGHINVYSEVGRGTTFRIYFPLVAANLEVLHNAAAPETIRGGTETILLAEDDKSIRGLSREVLSEYGYSVIEAADGEATLKIFLDNSDRIRLIITDVIMPKKSGREFYEEVQKTKPDIKIIFMSGYPSDLIQKEGILHKDVHFIAKPSSPHVLLQKVREVLDQPSL